MSTETNNQTTELTVGPPAQVRAPAPSVQFNGNIFSGSEQFGLAWKMAQALSRSTVVPKDYQGENGIGNCLIALEMSTRLSTSPLMVMQNLYVVNGRPAWSSQYIVAIINSSRKYKTELQYCLEGKGDDMSCYAFAEDHNGHKVVGPTITMDMAKKEGWIDKNGSKWKTMPEVMIRYRAASFFGRLNCPDMIMGIYSTDEVIELDESSYRVLDATEAQVEVEQEASEHANKTELDISNEEEGAAADQTKEEAPSAEDAPPAGGPDF